MSENHSSVRVPTYDEMLWPTLVALKEIGGSGTNQEIEEAVIKIEGYTESQQDVLHGDGPRSEISYHLAWSRTYLRKTGAIDNSARAVSSITDYGRSFTPADMSWIPAKARSMGSNTKVGTHDQSESFSGKGDESDWRTMLLEVLQAMPPDAFERLCQRLLRESGFTKVQVTGRAGDGGIDGIGVLRVSLLNFQVFFQAKRYKGSVGPAAIRDFRGAMVGRADKGLLITTGSFTTSAKDEATRDGAPVIDLIDGPELCNLLRELKLGVETELVEQVVIREDWFGQFLA